MNQNEKAVAKLLLVALALTLLTSTILLVTTTVQLTELRKLRELQVQSAQGGHNLTSAFTATTTNTVSSYKGAIPDTLTLVADRAASITRVPPARCEGRNWTLGFVIGPSGAQITVPQFTFRCLRGWKIGESKKSY
jgi:hypothetical protein